MNVETLFKCKYCGMKLESASQPHGFVDCAEYMHFRIAYLEEQLRWRPVSELPTATGAYEVILKDQPTFYKCEIDLYSTITGLWLRHKGNIIEWRPIPEDKESEE